MKSDLSVVYVNDQSFCFRLENMVRNNTDHNYPFEKRCLCTKQYRSRKLGRDAGKKKKKKRQFAVTQSVFTTTLEVVNFHSIRSLRHKSGSTHRLAATPCQQCSPTVFSSFLWKPSTCFPPSIDSKSNWAWLTTRRFLFLFHFYFRQRGLYMSSVLEVQDDTHDCRSQRLNV